MGFKNQQVLLEVLIYQKKKILNNLIKRFPGKMNFSRISLITLLSMAILPAALIFAAPQAGAFSGCACSPFSITNRERLLVGDCRKADRTGYAFCYIPKGCTNCEGASTTFPDKCKNYSKCRLTGMITGDGSQNLKV